MNQLPSFENATGAERLVEILETMRVEVVFGLPGVHNLPIWRALADSEIRLIGVRHEQAAVYAADGYARATGRPGVAAVTTGPGAANTLGATGEAMASQSPVVVVATDIAKSLRREGVYRGVLHETRDQAAMFQPVTKRATTIDSADEIPSALAQCLALSQAPPSGPTYLGIPTDLLSEPAESARPPGSLQRLQPSEQDLDEAAALVDGAQSVLIWAGGGALRSGAGDAVSELAEHLTAPVITTYSAKGLLPVDHPCLAPGPPHLPEIAALWDEADVVIAIGTDFDGVMTQNWTMQAPPVLVAINVDRDDASKNYKADVTIVGDALPATAALSRRTSPRDGLDALGDRMQALSATVRESVKAYDEHALQFLDDMGTVVSDDSFIAVDMCIPGYWLGGFHAMSKPRRFAYPLGWGTLGFGFPASLGAAMASSSPTVCICGDGGFLYCCGELATLAQQQLALTVVVVNDYGYGMLRFDQQESQDEPFGVDLETPDFVAMAQSFGIEGRGVEGFGPAFAACLADCLASRRPQVLVVRAALSPPPTTSPRWPRRKGVPQA